MSQERHGNIFDRRHLPGQAELACDVVIVGSGAGGSSVDHSGTSGRSAPASGLSRTPVNRCRASRRPSTIAVLMVETGSPVRARNRPARNR